MGYTIWEFSGWPDKKLVPDPDAIDVYGALKPRTDIPEGERKAPVPPEDSEKNS